MKAAGPGNLNPARQLGSAPSQAAVRAESRFNHRDRLPRYAAGRSSTDGWHRGGGRPPGPGPAGWGCPAPRLRLTR